MLISLFPRIVDLLIRFIEWAGVPKEQLIPLKNHMLSLPELAQFVIMLLLLWFFIKMLAVPLAIIRFLAKPKSRSSP